MIDHLAAVLALRARALGTYMVTTGIQTEHGEPVLTESGDIIVTDCGLSATTTGYARTVGSFLTDGFAVGQEVTPVGFTQTAVGVVQAVTASTLTIAGGRTAEATSTDKALYVAFPALRAWENTEFTPIAGRWYVAEEYLPGPAAQVTIGPRGQVETLPQYILTLYGLANSGVRPLYKCADALLACFAPRTAVTLSTGDVLTVQTMPAPYRGPIVPAEPGWTACAVTIPCSARSPNTF